jgi:hypothetical protein
MDYRHTAMQQPVLPIDSVTGECFFDHFVKHFDMPTGRSEVGAKDGKRFAQLMKFSDPSGDTVYATLGISRYPQKFIATCEIMLMVDQDDPTLIDILDGCISEMMLGTSLVGWGSHVRFEEAYPEFFQQYGKCALYLTSAGQIFENFDVQCADRTGLTVFFATLINLKEWDLLRSEGVEALERELSRYGHAVFSLSR